MTETAAAPAAAPADKAVGRANLVGPLLGAKILRIALSWVSAYFAAKLLQDTYIDKVFFKESEPPPLTSMVLTFLMFQGVFAAIANGMATTAYWVAVNKTDDVYAVAALSCVDAAFEIAVSCVVLFLVADVFQQKKYFNYRYEGLRAIRALRTLMFRATAAVSLVPFFTCVPQDAVVKMLKKVKPAV
jgi:hypothetical protein